MIYRVLHRTEYSYTTAAALSQNEACLQMRETPFQTIQEWGWETDPEADYISDRQDYFGNWRRTYAFERQHQKLSIECWHRVEVRPHQWGQNHLGSPEPYRFASPHIPLVPALSTWAESSFPPGRSPLDGLHDLNQRIYSSFVYDPKATTVNTSVEEFFHLGRGVCQDYSQLMISALRGLGIPARYVSGYLNTLPPPGKEKILGADASHAWVSAWLDGLGWIDLDPTNGIPVVDHHLVVSWGRDYGDVSPLKGVVLGGGAQSLKVEVSVVGQ